MLENLENYVDIQSLVVLLAFLAAAGAVGLWYVHRTTRRSYRDMLAVLAGAVVLIAFMMAGMIFFHDWLNSPDRHMRRMNERFFVFLYMLPVAVLIWWALNRIGALKRTLRKTGTDESSRRAQ